MRGLEKFATELAELRYSIGEKRIKNIRSIWAENTTEIMTVKNEKRLEWPNMKQLESATLE